MKVCHVINSLNRGGAESHLLELIKAQLDKDISVTVLVIGKDNSDIFSIENNIVELNVPIFRLKGPRMFNLSSYFRMYNYLILSSFDVVHSHQPRSDFMVYLLKKYLFSDNLFKWIVSIHGKYDSYLNNNIQKKFKLYFFKKLVKSWNTADEVIVISNEVKSWLDSHTKLIKPHVINYWISLKSYKSVDLNSPVNIGFLGRLNKNKGIEDLIESLNEVDLDFNLSIGGFGTENYINFLKQKMNENVLHLGYLTLRLSREKERKKIGEEEINQRILLLNSKGVISLKIEEDLPKNYNSQGRIPSSPVLSQEEYPSWAKK